MLAQSSLRGILLWLEADKFTQPLRHPKCSRKQTFQKMHFVCVL
jgi:hypothetical protein